MCLWGGVVWGVWGVGLVGWAGRDDGGGFVAPGGVRDLGSVDCFASIARTAEGDGR